MKTLFICPICQKPLEKEGFSLVCENRHCYDFSKSGYINLLNPGKMNNKKAGDNAEMIRARTLFLSTGAYEKIADTVCEILSKEHCSLVCDCGSGEGYYTEKMSSYAETVIGFELSKIGCDHASKSAKQKKIANVSYCVANIFSLPLKDDGADAVVSLFAPVAQNEFLRVLKKGGILIVGASGKKHLCGLKELLYSDVYDNEEKFPEYEGFTKETTLPLTFSVKIDGNDKINALFMMTPYYQRTSLEDKEKIKSVQTLSTTVEVNFTVYRKD